MQAWQGLGPLPVWSSPFGGEERAIAGFAMRRAVKAGDDFIEMTRALKAGDDPSSRPSARFVVNPLPTSRVVLRLIATMAVAAGGNGAMRVGKSSTVGG